MRLGLGLDISTIAMAQISGGGSPALGSAPVNTAAPVVSGNKQVGQTLSSTTGAWTGTPTITYTYQWKRNGSNISGATASTYTLALDDAGTAITCAVTGTNGSGNSTTSSNSSTIDAHAVFLTSLADTTDAQTYTFSSVPFGTAAANRHLIIAAAVRGASGNSVASASANNGGSVSMTPVVAQLEPSDTSQESGLWIADLPTGTSGSITVNVNGSTNRRCGVGVWALYNSSKTPSDTKSVGGSPDPASVTLSVPAGGVAIASGIASNGSTYTWTGITEQYDGAIESSITHSGASIDSAAGGSIAMSCDRSGTSSSYETVFASWGP